MRGDAEGQLVADGIVAGVDADGNFGVGMDEDVAAVLDDRLPAAVGHGSLYAHLRQGAGHRGHGAEPGEVGGGSHAPRSFGRRLKENNRNERGHEFGMTPDITLKPFALLDHGPGHQIKSLAGDSQVSVFPGKGAVDAHEWDCRSGLALLVPVQNADEQAPKGQAAMQARHSTQLSSLKLTVRVVLSMIV